MYTHVYKCIQEMQIYYMQNLPESDRMFPTEPIDTLLQ